ncbi:MAG: DedA family protein [Acidobacteriota bacterium]
MSLESLVQAYGYWAVLGGTFLEGETILVLGGLAAHRGYLSLPWVILAALVGSLGGDLTFFSLGRRHSDFFHSPSPAWRASVDGAKSLLDRYQNHLILTFRFMYGLRMVIPYVIGMSEVSNLRFISLNIASALLWTAVFGIGGYLVGDALELFIGDLKFYEAWVFAAIALIGCILWLAHFLVRRAGKRREGDSAA